MYENVPDYLDTFILPRHWPLKVYRISPESDKCTLNTTPSQRSISQQSLFQRKTIVISLPSTLFWWRKCGGKYFGWGHRPSGTPGSNPEFADGTENALRFLFIHCWRTGKPLGHGWRRFFLIRSTFQVAKTNSERKTLLCKRSFLGFKPLSRSRWHNCDVFHNHNIAKKCNSKKQLENLLKKRNRRSWKPAANGLFWPFSGQRLCAPDLAMLMQFHKSHFDYCRLVTVTKHLRHSHKH